MSERLADPEGRFGYSQVARGLRFVDGGVEAQYRQWSSTSAAPLIVVGMVLALLGGLTILATVQLLDEPWKDAWFGIVAIVSPGFVIAIGLARARPEHPWLLPVAALVGAIWGSVLVHGLHNTMDAGELGTTAVLLVGLWCLVVFRLPPRLGLLSCATFSVIHQVNLVASDRPMNGGAALHSVVTWLVLVAAVMVSWVVDRTRRAQFASEAVITAQNAVIEQERQRVDDLLRNVLPDAVADRLQDGGGRIADYHESVTVLFADVVGFTWLSTQLPPQEVVDLLDTVFRRLDDIVDARGVEKIKTVGDAYMAVAGAPHPRPDHTEAIAEVGLDILGALQEFDHLAPDGITMRIGIASGDAVAGVIGRRKFAYDLWSDTVNTAARMESHGLPGRIQVSETTAGRLADRYVLEERGVIQVKGKGPVRTWFLNGRKTS